MVKGDAGVAAMCVVGLAGFTHQGGRGGMEGGRRTVSFLRSM